MSREAQTAGLDPLQLVATVTGPSRVTRIF